MASLVATELTDQRRTLGFWSSARKAFLWVIGDNKRTSIADADKSSSFDRYPGAMDTFRRTMEAMGPYGFL